jgi:hypothetical protein
LGAYTVPLTLVVAGAVQVTCWVQSPTQVGAPHWLGMPPPPHVSGAVHAPQLSVFPQPSPCVPQLTPSEAHVAGVQMGAPQTLGVPPPPQVVLAGHVEPHWRTLPQPSLIGPQALTAGQVAGTQTPASLVK